MKNIIILIGLLTLLLSGCDSLGNKDSYVLCGYWVTESHCPTTHNAAWIGGQCLSCNIKRDINYVPINMTEICTNYLNRTQGE